MYLLWKSFNIGFAWLKLSESRAHIRHGCGGFYIICSRTKKKDLDFICHKTDLSDSYTLGDSIIHPASNFLLGNWVVQVPPHPLSFIECCNILLGDGSRKLLASDSNPISLSQANKKILMRNNLNFAQILWLIKLEGPKRDMLTSGSACSSSSSNVTALHSSGLTSFSDSTSPMMECPSAHDTSDPLSSSRQKTDSLFHIIPRKVPVWSFILTLTTLLAQWLRTHWWVIWAAMFSMMSNCGWYWHVLLLWMYFFHNYLLLLIEEVLKLMVHYPGTASWVPCLQMQGPSGLRVLERKSHRDIVWGTVVQT